jgi:hypothetical protein
MIGKENCELIGNKFECMYMKIICRKYVLCTLFYVVHKLLYILYGAQWCCDFIK